jgi:hypothetical protein
MTDHLLQSFCWPQAIAVFGGSPNLPLSCRCRYSGTGLPAQIAEMDLNPVILHEDGSGLTISDALILPKE